MSDEEIDIEIKKLGERIDKLHQYRRKLKQAVDRRVIEVKSGDMLFARLQIRREQLGMTQEELAKATGLSRVTINYLENGKTTTSIANFIKVNNVLKVYDFAEIDYGLGRS